MALAVTGRPDEAEDAVQDALLACLNSRAHPKNALAYLRVAVRNAAIRISRNSKASSGSDEALTWVQVEGEQERETFARQVNEALCSIASDHRETIVMHLYAGMSFREIAELQGRSINTVASWYRRGINQLKNRFEHEQ